jgi:hypothetical protein
MTKLFQRITMPASVTYNIYTEGGCKIKNIESDNDSNKLKNVSSSYNSLIDKKNNKNKQNNN